MSAQRTWLSYGHHLDGVREASWFPCAKFSFSHPPQSKQFHLAFLRQGFSLQDPQWGRITYTLRISWGKYWEYQKQIINLGFFSPFSRRMFLEIEPVHNSGKK